MHSVESMKDAMAWELAIKPTMTPAETVGEISDGYHTFNELYEHRHALFFALLTSNVGTLPVWMSKLHSDGTGMEGWFIAGIDMPYGTATYHIPMRLWDTYASAGIDVLERAPNWDGHTSSDVVKRLYQYAAEKQGV